MRHYTKQPDIRKFGRQLIETQDLDPVYVALVRAQMPYIQLRRWLLAYWCFYDCGVASYLSEHEGPLFWDVALVAANNAQQAPIGGRWRRGSERRHYRGEQAVKSLESMRDRFPSEPEGVAEYCAFGWPHRPSHACQQVMDRAMENRGFGSWIAFKVADMAERVMGARISFEEAQLLIWDSPSQGATLMALQEGREQDGRSDISWAFAELTREFADLDAPPLELQRRPVGVQEIETVLCKWKSHMSGHYPPGSDIREICHHLEPWHLSGICPTAVRIMDCMPEIPS